MTAAVIETATWFVWVGLLVSLVGLLIQTAVRDPELRRIGLEILAILVMLVLIALIIYLDLRAKGSL